jgi:membrane-associated protease RseP (regulator of RpoE activity)
MPLPDRQVIDALVHPAHAGPSPELARVLREWPGTYYWSAEPDGRHLVLTRLTRRARRENWTLHLLLFAATLLTTTYAGAVLAGALPADPFGFFVHVTNWDAPLARALARGLSFSLPLLAILLCHELGHFLTARHYGLDVSPPYFIPVPLVPSFIGTMGAFIRLRTILSDRRQLLDVGAAGPLAGFAVALPVLALGLAHSEALPRVSGGMVLWFGDTAVPLGDSLITIAARLVMTGGLESVAVHPVAFAGWVGMFVTMLNLLPIAQLDGGHVLYAAVPRWHQRVALAFWGIVVCLGWFWRGWLVWGFLVLALSRGRLGHPPVLDAYRPLPASRRWLSWGSLALFVLTFTPVPFPI